MYKKRYFYIFFFLCKILIFVIIHSKFQLIVFSPFPHNFKNIFNLLNITIFIIKIIPVGYSNYF